MVRITADFSHERVLHPAAKALLNEFFDQGWADPNKLNSDSRQSAILLQNVRESFAGALKVRPDEMEFLGETDLGFQLGIEGLLKPTGKLFYSDIDRQKVFAVAAHTENSGQSVIRLPVSDDGEIKEFSAEAEDTVVWQLANSETGNIQKSMETKAQVFLDCTGSGVDHLPNMNYQTALFDSTSWQGPTGLGILVIKSSARWRNPLPHNDLTRVPSTFSIPLAIASSVALENYLKDPDIRIVLKQEITQFLTQQVPRVDIASNNDGLSKYLSFSIAGVESDRLLLELEDQGFVVDSGSACKSADMQPSHVLAAMSRPITGNIRLTIHKDITAEMVTKFCQALKSCVEKLRLT